MGPDRRAVHGCFVESADADAPRLALWRNDVSHTRTMRTCPDVSIKAKPGLEGKADRVWAGRGRLLIAFRPWLVTNRVLAVRLDQPTVGGMWIPAKPREGAFGGADPAKIEKALCVWLNSSMGWFGVLWSGDRLHGMSRWHMGMESLRSIPVPDMDAEQTETLAAVFDHWCDATPATLAGAASCPVRRALDDAVVEHLGMDPDEVSAVREALASEPAATGRRAAT